jgi:uncharacterized ferritin-like protein (DUF455 family)
VTPIPISGLDPQLFAEDPARDRRFTVVDRWKDCTNYPEDHPMRLVEFLHRQTNEEINSLESSARSLVDFPEAGWDIRMWLARQCSDESRHAAMFRRLLERRGGHIGQFPVLNFQYRIIVKIANLIGRLTIQNRSFEAGGIDAIAFGIKEANHDGDSELAELYEAQLADEIVHVRFANEWVRGHSQNKPSTLLQIGAALNSASKAFFQVMGKEGTEGAGFPADSTGRLEAGFSEDEIQVASDMALTAHTASHSESGALSMK